MRRWRTRFWEKLTHEEGDVAKLSDEEVREGLSTLPDWEREGDAIIKEYRFAGFGDAIAFVVRVAFRAENANHHPDLDVRYNRVRVALSTHSDGGITAKDLALAAEVDAAA
jgi:4a-hydroxytetrahydrobiopterin dehydratase